MTFDASLSCEDSFNPDEDHSDELERINEEDPDFDREPDIDEAQEWADLPWGSDEDEGFGGYEYDD